MILKQKFQKKIKINFLDDNSFKIYSILKEN